jgi:hypothetical protein
MRVEEKRGKWEVRLGVGEGVGEGIGGEKEVGSER